MNWYIDALNRSRQESEEKFGASVKIELSSLVGKDWLDVMDDPAAVWQKKYLNKAVVALFEDAIWEIDGQFFGAGFLSGGGEQAGPQYFVDIFDQYVRAFPGQGHLNLERLVQLAGEWVLDGQLAA